MEEEKKPFEIMSLQTCAEEIKAVISALEKVKNPREEIATYAATIKQSAEFLFKGWEKNSEQEKSDKSYSWQNMV